MFKTKNLYIEYDDYYILKIISRKHGEFDVYISKESFDLCKKYNWNINRYKRTKNQLNVYYYIVNDKVGLLHRYLMGVAQRNQIVDHINGNTLDNRIENLQVLTHRQNLTKQKINITNKSGRPGVIFNKHLKSPKWVAYIYINNKYKHLGYFNTFEEAATCRENAENMYYGKYKSIDFNKQNM